MTTSSTGLSMSHQGRRAAAKAAGWVGRENAESFKVLCLFYFRQARPQCFATNWSRMLTHSKLRNTRLTASCRLTQRSKGASEMMRVDHLLVGGIWIQAILQPRKNGSNKGWKVFSVDLKWWLRHVETHRIKASMIKWQFTNDTYFACMSVCMYVTMNECVKLQLHDTIGSPQNILIFTEWLDGWMDAHETKHTHISAYSLQKNNTDQRWPNGNFPLKQPSPLTPHKKWNTTGKTGQTICFWPNHLSLGLSFKSIIHGIYWPCFPLAPTWQTQNS